MQALLRKYQYPPDRRRLSGEGGETGAALGGPMTAQGD